MDEVRKYAIANFNPLPPCGGRLLTAPPVLRRECYFNPLPPCGGSRRAYALRSKQRHFNPLPPCGGRPVKTVYDIMTDPISIHSLRVEGDLINRQVVADQQLFQSTPSVWRETCSGRQRERKPKFQSTPSVWREPPDAPVCPLRQFKFQSTPSVWRETAKLHSFPLKTQQSKCNFDKKEHRYTSPCQKKYFFSDFFTKKRVRISPAFFVRLGFAPERFLRTKAVPPHRWFPLRRYVPLSSDTDSPDSRTGGYLSRYRWHPSAAV